MNLRQKRESLGLTTKGTASRLGISTRQLNRIESNLCKKPISIEKAHKLAKIFGITVAEVRQLEGYYERRIFENTKENIEGTGEDET